MYRESECPSAAELERALSMDLPAADYAVLEKHLLSCDACARKTMEMNGLDTIATMMGGRPVPHEEEPDIPVARMTELIERMRRLPQSEAFFATQIQDSGNQDGGTDQDLGTSQHVGAGPDDCWEPSQAPDELGRLGTYRLLKVLGQGGMGCVFLAEDTLLRRKVALKLLRAGTTSNREINERFLREARAAASIHHDHVVTIFQVGQHGKIPFLAMELLLGESLDDRLKREKQLPLPEILRISREICEGLAAANELGMIHRDIKPANIWLEGARARVKLLDFGLARTAEENVQLTSPGVILGTPAFMSPEQAGGLEVTHRADLFSLGVVMYLMTTGKLPFLGTDTISMLIAIRSETQSDLRTLRPEISLDLHLLINRLLEKDPANRQPSASVVIAELQRIESPPASTIAHSVAAIPATTQIVPINYRPNTSGLRVMLAAAFLALIALAGVWIVVRDKQGNEVARIQQPEGGTVGIEVLPAVAVAKNESRVASKSVLPVVDLIPKPVGSATSAPEIKQPLPEPARHLPPISAAALVSTPAVIPGVESWTIETLAVRGMARSPNFVEPQFDKVSRRLAISGSDGVVRIFNCETGRPEQFLIGHGGTPDYLEWSPDGQKLITKDRNGSLNLWDVVTGAKIRSFQQSKRAPLSMSAPAFSPDGKLLANCFQDETFTLEILDVETGVRVGHCLDWKTYAMSWRDNQTLVCWDYQNRCLKRWDQGTRKLIQPVPLEGLNEQTPISGYAAWSADGAQVLVLKAANQVGIWDAESGKLVHSTTVSLNSHLLTTSIRSFTSHSLSEDKQTVELRDLSTGKTQAPLPLENQADQLCLSDDGHWLASWSLDGRTLQLYDVKLNKRQWEHARVDEGYDQCTNYVAWSPTGQQLLTGHRPRLWDVESRKLDLSSIDVPDSSGAAWSPDGKWIAFSGRRDVPTNISLYDVNKKRLLRESAESSRITNLAWSPNGSEIATVGPYDSEPMIKIWNASTLGLSRSLPTESSEQFFSKNMGSGLTTSVAWSRDQQRLLVSREVGILIQDSQTGKVLANQGGAFAAAWLRDDKQVLRGTLTLELHETLKQPGRVLYQPASRFQGCVHSLAAAPDNTQVAFANGTPEIQVRSLPDGDRIATLSGCVQAKSDSGKGLAWSPDGKTLAACLCDGGQFRLWETSGWKPQADLILLGGDHYAIISPDGHFAGSRRAESQLVYVVRTAQGQRILSPAEFSQLYSWKNDPSRVTLRAPLTAPSPASKPQLAATPQPAPIAEIKNPAPGDPIRQHALVSRPAKLPGVKSWTLESIAHRHGILVTEFSPDGQWLASADRNGAIRIWDSHRKSLHRLLLPPVAMKQMFKWSADSRSIATYCGESGDLLIWNIEAGQIMRQAKTIRTDNPEILDWSAQGDLLLVGNVSQAALLDAKTLEQVDQLLNAGLVRFLSDGKRIGSLARQGTIQTWDTQSLSRGPEVPNPPAASDPNLGASRRCDWSPDGKCVAVFSHWENTVWMVEATSGKLLWKKEGIRTFPDSGAKIIWSPDSQTLLKAEACLDNHTEMVFFQASTGSEAHRHEIDLDFPRVITHLSWSPTDLVMCASSFDDSTIRFLDLATYEFVDRIGSGEASECCDLNWVDDDQTLQSTWVGCSVDTFAINLGKVDGDVIFGRRPTGDRSGLDGKQHVGHSYRLLSRPDSSGPFIDGQTLTPPPTWGASLDYGWSADGKMLAVASFAGKNVCFYDYPAGNQIHQFPGISETIPTVVAISPNGVHYAYGTHQSDAMTVCKIADGEVVATTSKVGASLGEWRSLAFSPDGKYLACGSVEGVVRVWTSDLKEIASEFPGHSGLVRSILWSKNGQRLVTGGSQSDETTRTWNPLTGEPLGTLVKLRERYLLQISPLGHYRVLPEGAPHELVYVVETESGQQTLKPAEFEAKFGWKNHSELSVAK